MVVTVPTAALARTSQGTPFSDEFQDIYHSELGGLAQARHVFLAGNSLPQRWSGRERFAILETGFGLGLNFLAAWQAWRSDPARPRRLHFVSVEKSPFGREDLASALERFAELKPLAQALMGVWPPNLAGFHRMHFEAGSVMLTLLFGDVQELLPQLDASVDAFFLDGFSPSRNPGMWSPQVVREIARLAAPGATLATWTSVGGVRTALADAGFAMQKRDGFSPKRHMLVGTAPGEYVESRRPRHAVVVGGGLAGTLAAERLALRDWDVELVDGRATRSTSEVALVRPIANLRDAVNARISRSAFLYALQHFRSLQRDGYHLIWNKCGVLQLAGDDDEAARFEAIASSQGYPPDFLQFVGIERAAQIAGREVRGPGWWFPSGAVVSPSSLAVASLARAGPLIRRHDGRTVARLEREGSFWRALDAGDRVIAEAPTMVLANAADARRLLPEARLSLSSVRGQLTYVPAAPSRNVEVVVSGAGYVAPLFDGGHCIGSTYQHEDFDPAIRAADHRDNLARAEMLMPGFTRGIHPMQLGGWTGFRTTVPDRLPIFGATAVTGLHVATGLGSRGLLWGPLGAELLASAIEGEPLPLARDHAGAVSPRRFLS